MGLRVNIPLKFSTLLLNEQKKTAPEHPDQSTRDDWLIRNQISHRTVQCEDKSKKKRGRLVSGSAMKEFLQKGNRWVVCTTHWLFDWENIDTRRILTYFVISDSVREGNTAGTIVWVITGNLFRSDRTGTSLSPLEKSFIRRSEVWILRTIRADFQWILCRLVFSEERLSLTLSTAKANTNDSRRRIIFNTSDYWERLDLCRPALIYLPLQIVQSFSHVKIVQVDLVRLPVDGDESFGSNVSAAEICPLGCILLEIASKASNDFTSLCNYQVLSAGRWERESITKWESAGNIHQDSCDTALGTWIMSFFRWRWCSFDSLAIRIGEKLSISVTTPSESSNSDRARREGIDRCRGGYLRVTYVWISFVTTGATMLVSERIPEITRNDLLTICSSIVSCFSSGHTEIEKENQQFITITRLCEHLHANDDKNSS